jgi:hypothetical protein
MLASALQPLQPRQAQEGGGVAGLPEAAPSGRTVEAIVDHGATAGWGCICGRRRCDSLLRLDGTPWGAHSITAFFLCLVCTVAAARAGLRCEVEDGTPPAPVEASEFGTTPLPEDALAAIEATEEFAAGPIVNRCVCVPGMQIAHRAPALLGPPRCSPCPAWFSLFFCFNVPPPPNPVPTHHSPLPSPFPPVCPPFAVFVASFAACNG